MGLKLFSGSCAAAVLGCGLTLAAQTPTQTPPQTPPQQPRPSMSDQRPDAQSQPVTISGCVQKEGSVVKRSPMATNMGTGDEYVIIMAAVAPDTGMGKSPAETEPSPSATTGTSGTSQGKYGKVYRASGDKESDLKNYVGQRVEITGNVKQPDNASKDSTGATGTSGRMTGEPTTDNTPELVVLTIRPTSGSCPAPDSKDIK